MTPQEQQYNQNPACSRHETVPVYQQFFALAHLCSAGAAFLPPRHASWLPASGVKCAVDNPLAISTSAHIHTEIRLNQSSAENTARPLAPAVKTLPFRYR